MNTYIDVRGPWPILFMGFHAYELRNQPREITVQQALKLISEEMINVQNTSHSTTNQGN